MIKEKKYNDSNGNLRTLINTSPNVSEEEIIKMNLYWKNSTMISSSTWEKKVLHGFLSWHLRVDITLNDEIMERYFVLIQKQIKSEKSILFDDQYEEFLKLQITRFYDAKSKTHYLHKDFLNKNLMK